MSDDERIESLLAELLAQRQAGRRPDLDAMLSEHPDLVGELDARWRVVEMLDRLEGRGAAPPPTVCEILSRSGSKVHPVSVPDARHEEVAPVALRAPSGQRWGRYEVQGEIARGGVGVVLKARDPELGRDVALKVLREEHVTNDDAVQRLIDEAQVGGQLLHPGVVPVYELGIGAEGHPFFAMKLVKGRTLAQLLAGRREPAQEQARLLAIFEAVCQTVAYAHDRLVVHRDLKPSNVMVGSFGEVQVVDWGMAKVLAHRDAGERPPAGSAAESVAVSTRRSSTGSAPSLIGTVLGTPQYMPPEQARGDLHLIDERSDVFALGAMLCEILTGVPPYAGNGASLLEQAARAELGEAQQRLDGCGADPALVGLARACLSSAPEDRPANASVVAQGIAAYRSGLEGRAKRAEAEAVAARARAAAERRTRRLTLALAVTVIAAMGAAAAGWVVLSRREAEKVAVADGAVVRALTDASDALGKARADEAPESWERAVAAADRARSLAQLGEASPGLSAQATRQHAEILALAKEAAEERNRRERDRRMTEDLSRLILEALSSDDLREMDAQFAAAYQEYGLDIRGKEEGDIARRIQASSIATILVHGLDSWARMSSNPAPLRSLALRADLNAWRTRVRQASNAEGLLSVARDFHATSRDAHDALLLAQALILRGAREQALEVARSAVEAHPADPVSYGLLLLTSTQMITGGRTHAIFLSNPANMPGGGAVAEALRSAHAMTILVPRSELAWSNYASCLAATGDLEAARVAVKRVVALAPDSFSTHSLLGRLAEDPTAAVAHFNRAASLAPNEIVIRVTAGDALRRQGRARESKEHLLVARTLSPENPHVQAQLAETLWILGEDDSAEGAAREALRLDPDNTQARIVLGAVQSRRGRLAEAESSLREALRGGANAAPALSHLGQVLCMQGRYVEATECFRASVTLAPSDLGPLVGLTGCLLATGQTEEALAIARRADRLDPTGRTSVKLAQILSCEQRNEEAERVAERALALGQESAVNQLGGLLLRRGDLEGALRVLHGVPSEEPFARHVERMLRVQRNLPAKLGPPAAGPDAALVAEALLISGRLEEGLLVVDALTGGTMELLERTTYAAATLARQTQEARWVDVALRHLERQATALPAMPSAELRVLYLRRMQMAPALADLRDANALAKLQPEQRQRALAVWGRVALALQEMRR